MPPCHRQSGHSINVRERGGCQRLSPPTHTRPHRTTTLHVLPLGLSRVKPRDGPPANQRLGLWKQGQRVRNSEDVGHAN